MDKSLVRTNRAVRRHNAQNYMLLMLIGFSVSVIVTRTFLTLTGFPKIGTGELHIAHLLWGGVLLFIAATMMFTLANRWVYSVGAILAGIGVGLFIDEVGKFITTSNDYFYPLAIPIIYGFFLFTVLLYLRARRPVSQDPRAELYRCLEMFQELLDHDLEKPERDELEARLSRTIAASTSPDLTVFAQSLLDFLKSKEVKLAPDRSGIIERVVRWLQRLERTRLGRRRLKVFLIAGVGILGILTFGELAGLLVAALNNSPVALSGLTAELAAAKGISNTAIMNWYLIQLVLEGVIGVILIGSSLLLIFGRDKQGNEIGYIGLLLSLTVVNLLLFYFEQFGNVALTLFELLLLLGMIQYRNLYLAEQPQKASADKTTK